MLDQLKMLQGFMKDANLDLGSIMGLMSGKADNKQIVSTINPLMTRLSPYVGNAIRYLEKKHQQPVFMIISMQLDQRGKEVETITICGQDEKQVMYPLENDVPLSQLAAYVMGILEQERQADSATTKQLKA
jgi:hypothetical protein